MESNFNPLHSCFKDAGFVAVRCIRMNSSTRELVQKKVNLLVDSWVFEIVTLMIVLLCRGSRRYVDSVKLGEGLQLEAQVPEMIVWVATKSYCFTLTFFNWWYIQTRRELQKQKKREQALSWPCVSEISRCKPFLFCCCQQTNSHQFFLRKQWSEPVTFHWQRTVWTSVCWATTWSFICWFKQPISCCQIYFRTCCKGCSAQGYQIGIFSSSSRRKTTTTATATTTSDDGCHLSFRWFIFSITATTNEEATSTTISQR